MANSANNNIVREFDFSSVARVVLKLSGEALLSADTKETIDAKIVDRLAIEIVKSVSELGIQIAIVIGGGNIWRGAVGEHAGIERSTSDTMGMLATVINALALQSAIERHNLPTRVLSAIQMAEVAEPYIRRRAIRHLEKGRVVIFAAGMGNPYFTTDTPAALRAAEIGADLLLKGTHSGIDGVYTSDPKKDSNAEKYEFLTYDEVFNNNLRFMDMTATTFLRDNQIPVLVFDISESGNIYKALSGERVGTLIK